MAGQLRLAAILFFFASQLCFCAGCDVDNVAVYKVTLRTLWSEERFPKDYPKSWPKAQWSPVFGQSHNSSYCLHRLGLVSRASVLQYCQAGTLDALIQEGDVQVEVYDQFSAPEVKAGVGETGNMVFVDGKHSLVSMMCRMVPSPDWFVGVDSVDLCVGAAWVEQITLDLEPLDGGAASGLAFTAPRWETTPPEPVTRLAPRSPNHPAAGFYYPELKTLPTIATVQFAKIKEYSSKELNELARKEVMARLKRKDIRKGIPKRLIEARRLAEEENKRLMDDKDNEPVEEFTTKNSVEQLKDLEEDPVGTPRPNIPDNNVVVVTEAPKTTTTTTTTTTEPEFGSNLQSMDDVMLAVARGRKLGLGRHLPRHFRSRLHHAVNKLTEIDCLVSPWGPWSPCSVTCGFGDKYRRRRVLRPSAPRGRACPPLTEREHCGNANSCFEFDYFDW